MKPLLIGLDRQRTYPTTEAAEGMERTLREAPNVTDIHRVGMMVQWKVWLPRDHEYAKKG
jgi:hypothetical protein